MTTRTRRQLNPIAVVVSLAMISTSAAAELTIAPTIDTSVVQYKTTSDQRDDIDNRAIMIEPRLLGSYQTRLLDIGLSVDHTQVFQDKNSTDLDKSFTDYSLNSRLGLLNDRFNLQLSSRRAHRALSLGEQLVSDPILNAEDLTKTRSDNASVHFGTLNPAYIGLDMSASGSRTRAERDVLNQNRSLDNDNLSGSLRLFDGRRVSGVFWDLSGQYTQTSRSQRGDFKSTNLRAKIGVDLFSSLKFILTGNEQSNEIEGSDFLTDSLDSTTYGAGLEWRPSDNRYFSITYNRYERADETDNYVGADINWAFSRHTSVQARYDKQFFGDNYLLNLTHNTRAWRSQIGYSESLTSYSRLQFNEESLGVFICPLGSVNIADCRQPDSPNYIPEADEQLLNLNGLNAEITDEIVLRRSANISLGYHLRKLTFSASYQYGYLDYIESDREQRNRGGSLGISYKMGPRTRLSLQSNINKVDGINGGNTQDVSSHALTFNRKLNPNMDINLSYRYLQRESENNQARDLEDNRLTLTLKYRL